MKLSTVDPDITFHLNEQSFEYWREWMSSLGVLVCGRTLFDFTEGWGGRHMLKLPGDGFVTVELVHDQVGKAPDVGTGSATSSSKWRC